MLYLIVRDATWIIDCAKQCHMVVDALPHSYRYKFLYLVISTTKFMIKITSTEMGDFPNFYGLQVRKYGYAICNATSGATNEIKMNMLYTERAIQILTCNL